MFDDLNDLYQQVILDHCKKPRNFHEMPQATCSAQGHNPLCGDKLKLFLLMDGGTIKEFQFSMTAQFSMPPSCTGKPSSFAVAPAGRPRSSKVISTSLG